MDKNSKFWEILFFVLVVITLIFRLCHIGGIELSFDEAYYWEWSRHLALSYSDQGPVLGLVIFVITKLFGRSTEFTVRLGAVLFSSGTLILIYSLTKEIFKSARAGFYSALFANLIPLFGIGSMIMAPDLPMVFFWTLSLYFVYKAVNSQSSIWWYLAGLSTGLGLMSKYTMAFFVFSIFLYLLFSKKHKGWLIRKEPYIALIVALIVCLPMFIWNISNDLPVYKYYKDIGMSKGNILLGIKSFGLKGMLIYFLTQIGIITPFVFLYFVYAVTLLGLKSNNDDYLMIFINWITVFMVFAVFSVFTVVQENWAVPGYMALCIAGGGFLSTEFFEKMKSEIMHKALIVYIVFSFVFSGLLVGAVYIQTVHSLFPLPALIDPADEKVRGWKTLAGEVSELMEKSSDDTFLLSNYYGVASELSFYVKGRPYVPCVNVGKRLRQYEYWTDWNSYVGRDAIYVKIGNQVGSSKGIEPVVADSFYSVKLEKTLSIYRDDKFIRKFSIYFCKRFKRDGLE